MAYREFDSSMPDISGCWVLADGLGGHGGGREAAQLAVDTVLETHKKRALGLTKETLEACFQNANQAIMAAQDQSERHKGMRTTLVVLLARENQALWAHVGDSRLYHFRAQPGAGQSYVRTKDHSVPQVLVDAGDILASEIRDHQDRNRLLRTMGSPEVPVPDIVPEPVNIRVGDAFLLCSDGFWEYITGLEMEVDLAKATSPEHWVDLMSVRLTKKSYADQDSDNFSAIAIFVAD